MLLAAFAILFTYGYIVTPALAIYSWLRWARSQRRRSRRVRLSLSALAMATLALLLGLVAIAVSSARHNVFLYLSPEHRVLYFTGLALSAVSAVLALLGALQSNPIRIKALVVAFGTVSLWFLAGSGR